MRRVHEFAISSTCGAYGSYMLYKPANSDIFFGMCARVLVILERQKEGLRNNYKHLGSEIHIVHLC
jgi:hypothetical protein